MSRWKVKRVRFRLTGGWGEWAAFPSREQFPFSNEEAPTRYFLTHAEALAYADQQARTVEMTLPRLDPRGKQKIGGTGLFSLHVGHGAGLTHIYLGGWEAVSVESQDLEPLGLYLLALAHNRKTTT